MEDLTGFQRDLLYVVAGMEGSYGLEIKEELASYYGSEVNHGTLYPNLNSLAESGLIEKRSIDNRTNSYSLTSKAREHLAEHREWQNQYLDERD